MGYRKIEMRMWGDEKFLSLSSPPPSGKFLWVYLLTGPHTTRIPGVCSIGEAALAEALSWPLKGFRKVLAEVIAQDLIKVDWKTRFLLIPNAIKYNPPKSPNVVIGWKETWESLPECPLKQEAYDILKDFLKDFPKENPGSFLAAFDKSCGKSSKKTIGISRACAGTETETETETEQNNIHSPPAPENSWLQSFNAITKSNFQPVEGNLRPIRARIREGYTLEQAEQVLRYKTAQWQNDTKMAEFLRPITLFSPKFDSYLQEARRGGSPPRAQHGSNGMTGVAKGLSVLEERERREQERAYGNGK